LVAVGIAPQGLWNQQVTGHGFEGVEHPVISNSGRAQPLAQTASRKLLLSLS
jgi:hypothetical protein